MKILQGCVLCATSTVTLVLFFAVHTTVVDSAGRFTTEPQCPIPEIIDTRTEIVDPKAKVDDAFATEEAPRATIDYNPNPVKRKYPRVARTYGPAGPAGPLISATSRMDLQQSSTADSNGAKTVALLRRSRSCDNMKMVMHYSDDPEDTKALPDQNLNVVKCNSSLEAYQRLSYYAERDRSVPYIFTDFDVDVHLDDGLLKTLLPFQSLLPDGVRFVYLVGIKGDEDRPKCYLLKDYEVEYCTLLLDITKPTGAKNAASNELAEALVYIDMQPLGSFSLMNFWLHSKRNYYAAVFRLTSTVVLSEIKPSYIVAVSRATDGHAYLPPKYRSYTDQGVYLTKHATRKASQAAKRRTFDPYRRKRGHKGAPVKSRFDANYYSTGYVPPQITANDPKRPIISVVLSNPATPYNTPPPATFKHAYMPASMPNVEDINFRGNTITQQHGRQNVPAKDFYTANTASTWLPHHHNI